MSRRNVVEGRRTRAGLTVRCHQISTELKRSLPSVAAVSSWLTKTWIVRRTLLVTR
jgi:hypothetical protein